MEENGETRWKVSNCSRHILYIEITMDTLYKSLSDITIVTIEATICEL